MNINEYELHRMSTEQIDKLMNDYSSKIRNEKEIPEMGSSEFHYFSLLNDEWQKRERTKKNKWYIKHMDGQIEYGDLPDPNATVTFEGTRDEWDIFLKDYRSRNNV